MYRGRRIAAVVQARMGSTRLPGKVLMPLCHRPVLWHVIERLKASGCIDEIIVATSVTTADDAIARFIADLDDPGVRCLRGPEDDVLERFYLAICRYNPDVVVRITADSPLLSIRHLRRLVTHLVDHRLDGVDAHLDHTGLTLGFGSEAYHHQAIVDAHLLAATPAEREHVSLFIKQRPYAFRVEYPEPRPALCTDFRLTLDYPEDYHLLCEIYDTLYRPGEVIDCLRVVEWLRRRPDLVRLNAHCVQKSA